MDSAIYLSRAAEKPLQTTTRNAKPRRLKSRTRNRIDQPSPSPTWRCFGLDFTSSSLVLHILPPYTLRLMHVLSRSISLHFWTGLPWAMDKWKGRSYGNVFDRGYLLLVVFSLCMYEGTHGGFVAHGDVLHWLMCAFRLLYLCSSRRAFFPHSGLDQGPRTGQRGLRPEVRSVGGSQRALLRV
jgi:hypothetical protein